MHRMQKIVAALLGLALAGIAGAAQAQGAYPSKPIRLIVPYSAGGSVTLIARLAGERLSQKLGQPVVVDNRPGGNTIIGEQLLVKSPPDGYTLLMAAVDHTIVPSLLDAPYTLKDFAAVAAVASADYILVVNPKVPATTVKELIALAKAKPGSVNYGSSAVGGSAHLAGELFNSVAGGAKIQHVPYNGAPTVDLLGGHIQASFISPVSIMGFLKSGELRALATTGETRTPGLPDVPTFAEAGLPGVIVQNWYGILAPARTPKDVIDKVSLAIREILATPEFGEELAKRGMRPFPTTPEQFSALIDADAAKYGKVIKDANIKLQQ